MGSIWQYFDASLWIELIRNAFGHLDPATFWIATLQIVLINILLSGDNAVVIALACRGLPNRQRLWGLFIGAGAAVVLRIVLTIVIAELIRLPWLKIAGGLALFYIAFKLVLPEDEEEKQITAESRLWRAVRIIVVADLIMSFDNVIAVATAARGNLGLLAVGLALSIPMIIGGAAVMLTLLDRFPALIWIGAALLGSVAGEAIVTDPAISGPISAAAGEHLSHYVDWLADVVGALLVVAAGLLWRRLHPPKAGSA